MIVTPSSAKGHETSCRFLSSLQCERLRTCALFRRESVFVIVQRAIERELALLEESVPGAVPEAPVYAAPEVQ